MGQKMRAMSRRGGNGPRLAGVDCRAAYAVRGAFSGERCGARVTMQLKVTTQVNARFFQTEVSIRLDDVL